MIGLRIESRRQPPWMAGLLLAAGLLLVIVALGRGEAAWAIGAALPGALAVALAWAREPAFAMRLTETGLEVEDPPVSVPYERMEGLWGQGRPRDPGRPWRKSFAIQVAHDRGVLRIPRRLNVPSDEVYRFLATRFSPGGSRDVNPLLAEYLEHQVATFGAECVWTYRAAQHRAARPLGRRGWAAGLAVVLAGLVWIIAGALRPKEAGWIGAGVACLLFGLLASLLAIAQNLRAAPVIRGWRQASLVIGPEGLAMVQGDVAGEIRWHELRGVRLDDSPRRFQLSSCAVPQGIILEVEGARIVIADLYDRPLHVIFEQIRANRP
ncbi:MAG: hypothetical protein IRY99_14490 [Isosphaeraceae bacterium]|nr:hypothetical protein [Isosphaeraceae bacterium]